jgi:hypothetical protein
MKLNDFPPYTTILLALLMGFFLSGCIAGEPNPTNWLSADKVSITVDEEGSGAWYNLMPLSGDSKHPHILVPITIENNAGFDLNDLQIFKAEVLQDGKVIGTFKPWFQTDFYYDEIAPECQISEQNPRRFDLKDGCKLKFNIRSDREGDNTAEIDSNKPIKIRFKFVNKDYFTDTYESKEMNIDRAY